MPNAAKIYLSPDFPTREIETPHLFGPPAATTVAGPPSSTTSGPPSLTGSRSDKSKITDWTNNLDDADPLPSLPSSLPAASGTSGRKSSDPSPRNSSFRTHKLSISTAKVDLLVTHLSTEAVHPPTPIFMGPNRDSSSNKVKSFDQKLSNLPGEGGDDSPQCPFTPTADDMEIRQMMTPSKSELKSGIYKKDKQVQPFGITRNGSVVEPLDHPGDQTPNGRGATNSIFGIGKSNRGSGINRLSPPPLDVSWFDTDEGGENSSKHDIHFLTALTKHAISPHGRARVNFNPFEEITVIDDDAEHDGDGDGDEGKEKSERRSVARDGSGGGKRGGGERSGGQKRRGMKKQGMSTNSYQRNKNLKTVQRWRLPSSKVRTYEARHVYFATHHKAPRLTHTRPISANRHGLGGKH